MNLSEINKVKVIFDQDVKFDIRELSRFLYYSKVIYTNILVELQEIQKLPDLKTLENENKIKMYITGILKHVYL